MCGYNWSILQQFGKECKFNKKLFVCYLNPKKLLSDRIKQSVHLHGLVFFDLYHQKQQNS